jgi:hypothetical protein
MNKEKKSNIWRDKELVYKGKKNKSIDISGAGSTNISNSLKKRKVSFSGIEYVDIENFKHFNSDESSNKINPKKKDNVNCVCIVF